MSWSRAHRGDLNELLELVRGAEWRAVPISSRLRPARGEAHPALPSRLEATVLIHREKARAKINGLLLLSSSGLLLPLLAGGSEAPPLFPARKGLFRALHSVMGPQREAGWAEQGLAEKPQVSVDYHLMVLSRETFRSLKAEGKPPLRGLRLRAAAAADAKALFPLQRSYELEEVIVSPGRFNEQVCLANLKNALRRQIVFIAELDGRAVAKAGTNARGFAVDQIGGVYTVEGMRSRGVAHFLMRTLLERIFIEKKAVCLFVKQRNRPALALYRRLGFSTAEGYRISYYRD